MKPGTYTGSFRLYGGGQSVTVPVTLTITSAAPSTVSSITLTPSAPSVQVRQTQQFVATARDASGNPMSGLTFTWATSNPTVASITSAGLASGLSEGIAMITATSGTVSSNSATLTVAPSTVSSITLTPSASSVQVNQTQQLVATARDASGNTISGLTFTWATSNPTVASITSAGLASGLSEGTATITATSGTVSSNQATVTVTAVVSTSPGFDYPLTVGPTSRYLVDQNGKPFLLVGDTAWAMIAALSDADADVYLESRRQLGFTGVLVSLIEHKFAANPPANFYGITPFTGQAFTTPKEAYFAHVDYIVQSAATKGIVILLSPLYLGYICGSDGWCPEVQAATTSQLMAWGQYVGNRYKNYDNIVWVIGGDTDPTPVKSKVQAMVNGILSADSRHLFTAHNDTWQMAVTPWLGAAWLNVNNVYTYSGTLYQQVLSAYSFTPTMPVFLVESAYENEHGVTNQQLRAQSYWTVLSGGFGHVFGNCPIWGFGFANGYCSSTNWKAQLNSVGSVNMQHFAALFNSRRWQTLVPDTSRTILTAGSRSFGGSDYAMAACAADGSSILAYLPSSRRVTVRVECLVGNTMTAWWYNPGTGVASQIGVYPSTGTQSFTPPSSGDWVLVLDSTTFTFPPPGSK
jgi:hypothetical protein